MDYTESLDKLIKDFAGETGGLLKRVSDLGKNVDYIQENVSEIIETLASYKTDAGKTAEMIADAALIFGDLEKDIAVTRDEIAVIGSAQQKQAETLGQFGDMGTFSDYISRLLHDTANIAAKADKISVSITEKRKADFDSNSTTKTRLFNISSQVGETQAALQAGVKTIHDDILRTEEHATAISKLMENFSEKQAKQKTVLDNAAKYIQSVSMKCDELHIVAERLVTISKAIEKFSDQQVKQKTDLDNITKAIQCVSTKCDELTTVAERSLEYSTDALEKCSRIQSEQLQLSARLDKIAKDAEASKIKAEEDRQQTQAQLTGILQKLDALDNKIPEKKRGLFR